MKRSIDAKDDDESSSNPIVFIGVHLPADDTKEIEKVLEKYELKAPICIDRQQSAEYSWGAFFTACEINSMPTSVAVR